MSQICHYDIYLKYCHLHFKNFKNKKIYWNNRGLRHFVKNYNENKRKITQTHKQ